MNTNYKEKLICVILAGGKGSRLDGKGKFNQKFNNITLLEHVYERIKSQFSYIAVNVNNKETNVKLNVEVIYDKFSKNIGPLAGIHASLSQGNNINGEEGYVCIVPVDTPFLPKDLGKRLYSNMLKNNSDVVFAKSANRIHPTIGLWKNNLKKKLELDINKRNLLCIFYLIQNWCGREDLNLQGVSSTTTSTLRVYQFRHDRSIFNYNQFFC